MYIYQGTRVGSSAARTTRGRRGRKSRRKSRKRVCSFDCLVRRRGTCKHISLPSKPATLQVSYLTLLAYEAFSCTSSLRPHRTH